MAGTSRAELEEQLRGYEFEESEDLAALGAAVVPTLVEIAQTHADALVRARALVTLGRIGDARAVPAARAALHASLLQERVSAIQALSQVAGAASTPDLVALLQDAEPVAVQLAVQGLAAVGGADAVAALQHLAAHAPADFLKPLVAAAVAEINTRTA